MGAKWQKDGARSGALRETGLGAAFEWHMRWAEKREGVGISGGEGGGQHHVQGRTRDLDLQGRKLEDEK